MRTLFSIILIGLLTSTFSQIKMGAQVIDLSTSFSNSGDNSFFFIQPLLGFTISDNQLIYAGINYSYQKAVFGTNTSKDNSASLVLGYEKFIEMNKRIYFSPFISGSYGLGKSEGFNSNRDFRNLSISLRPRLHYFITSKWSIVASVGAIQYSRQVEENGSLESTSNFFSASLNGSNVFFGIRLNLNNE